MNVVLDTFKQARGKSKTWLVPVFEGRLGQAAKAFGFDRKQAADWGFDGKPGQVQHCNLPKGKVQILLLGAGRHKEFSADGARQLLAKGLRSAALQGAKPTTVLFVGSNLSGHACANQLLAEAYAEAAMMGSYAFRQLKAKGTKDTEVPSFPRRVFVALDKVRKIDRDRFKDGLIMGRWTNWARDLLNQPQSHINATLLANRARAAARPLRKVHCTVMSKNQIAALNMRLFLAVNQGSTEPPRLIVLRYSGARASDRPICLIGKGLTFDTGGYNMKPGDSMRGMHMDKGGGVAALSSFFAAAEMGIKKNIICVVPATDNRVSGNAIVPGDVFVGLNGISVEIDNTDAEGRLVLADALAYSKKFNPTHIVDMATLTGAAVVALGDQASALFCNDDQLAEQLLHSAEEASELAWRLPLWKDYNSKLKSFTADVKNVGNRWGGAITAALFLQRFVPDDVKWCHIDMAGKMKAEGEQAYTPSGSAYGFGPRLVGRWLRSV